MIQAVGYIRVSTTIQDFERQRDEINEYAKKNDFVVAKFFEDKHSGSDYQGRKGYQSLIAYLEEHPEIKIVILDEVSRMGRETAEQVFTYKKLTQKGIKIYTRGKGEFGRNKEDNLLFTVLSAISEYEKQTIIDRTSSGRRRVVREGATQISRKPYGYNILFTEKKDRQVIKRQFVEVDKDESAVVRQIFTMTEQGSSASDIVRWLKRNGIKSPTGNNIWGKTTIRRILHNTMYYGKWAWGKYYKNGKTRYSLAMRDPNHFIYVDVPPIITKELFDRVQVKIKETRDRFNPKNQKQIYLLKGFLKCHCQRYVGSYLEIRSKVRIHRCPQRNMREIFQKDCPIHEIKCDFLEKILLQELRKKILDENYFRKTKLEMLRNYQAPLDDVKDKMRNLQQNITKEERLLKYYYEKTAKLELENSNKSKIFEDLADTKLEEIQKFKENLSSLQKELTSLETNSIDMGILKDIKKSLQLITQRELETLNQSKQDFFQRYVKEVQVKFLQEETRRLRDAIKKLRQKGIFRKNNGHLKKLYFTCFTREHRLKSLAMQVLSLQVKFINNLVIEIKFPYFHKNPELAYNYILNNKNIEFILPQ